MFEARLFNIHPADPRSGGEYARARGQGSAAAAAVTAPLAELRTPDGVFLIQERRARPREDLEPAPAQKAERVSIANSPPMMALGGLIIIGVLIGSYTTKFQAALGHVEGALPVPAVGFLALQLFLARAAFRLYEEVREYGHLGDFVLNRAFRYLPAAVPGVLVGFFLLKAFRLPGFHAEAASLPANLLLVADMFGVPDIDGSHWRLKIEVLQTILVAVAWFGPLRRHVPVLLTQALGVTALFAGGEPVRQNALSLCGLLTIDGYLPFFTFGIALCELEKDRGSRLWQAMLVASAFLAFRSNTPVHGLVVVAGLAVLTALVFGRLEAIGRFGWLNHLGAIAFPVYVVHYVLGFVVIHRLEHVGCPAFMAIIVASTIALLAGEALHRICERPLQKRGPVVVKAVVASVACCLPSRSRAAAAA